MSAARDIEAEVIDLPADLGIEELASLREGLVARLHSDAPVLLDGSHVARVHGAVMQLLCMFCVGRDKAGRTTRWQAPSATLRQAAATLALNPLLHLTDN